jgi:hypothetical protein
MTSFRRIHCGHLPSSGALVWVFLGDAVARIPRYSCGGTVQRRPLAGVRRAGVMVPEFLKPVYPKPGDGPGNHIRSGRVRLLGKGHTDRNKTLSRPRLGHRYMHLASENEQRAFSRDPSTPLSYFTFPGTP